MSRVEGPTSHPHLGLRDRAPASGAGLLAVPLCGDRVIMRIESVGVRTLADLEGRDPWELMHQVNLPAGRTIWRPPFAILALQNLVASRGSRQ